MGKSCVAKRVKVEWLFQLAKNTLNNGGYVRIYSSARSSAGCVELDIANFNDEVNTCIDNHIAELESEIETL